MHTRCSSKEFCAASPAISFRTMHALQLRLVTMLPTAALPRKEHLTASKDAAGRPVQQGQTIEGHIGGATLCCKLTRLSSSSRWCMLRQWRSLKLAFRSAN